MIHNTARLPLPALVSAGAAGDLRSGKQLIGADGSIVTGTMPEVAGKTITPGTTAQTAVAAGRYITGDVVVAGDSSLKAENIAEGVTIFDVTGTHSGGGQLYSVTDGVNNTFYPKQAAAGEFVTTVSGKYIAEVVKVYDTTTTYVLTTPVSTKYDYLPPQVKEIIDQYSQPSNAAADTPITRAVAPSTTGYLYFVMPAQDVIVIDD